MFNRIRGQAAKVLILLGLCVTYVSNSNPLLAQTPTAQPATASTAPTTGQRIGNIIKDVIGSAFPGVSGIGGLIDAIWSHKPTNGNPNKAQLQTAVTNSQDDIKKSIMAQAQQHLVPITEVADELQAVSQFGVPTTTASVDILKMSDRLKTGKTLSDDEWTQQRADWEEAKGELATVKTADPSKVQDLWLRDKLSKIQQTNITDVARIDTELKAKNPNVGRLNDLLAHLYSTLQDISAAIGYEVTNMQADLKSLSAWARGAAGSEHATLTPEGKKYSDFLNNRYK
jgi:hypothetical protein